MTREITVDRFGEKRIDDLVFLFLLDQDVEIEFGTQRRDLLHELQSAHLQAARRFLAVSVRFLMCDEITTVLIRRRGFVAFSGVDLARRKGHRHGVDLRLQS